MSYNRVVPRDLFNEGNLLNCYGQLYLQLELIGLQHYLLHVDHPDGFRVLQDPDDGSIYLANLGLVIGNTVYSLYRPLNSRQPWPLHLTKGDGSEIRVFNDDGTLSDDMRAFLDLETDAEDRVCNASAREQRSCGSCRFT